MKILTWIQQHQKKLLFAAIALYIAIFSAICLWKYSIFGYNGLDLAIFNNVFWNTSEGRLFEMSIHPHSYLGDHAGFGILALIPFYWLYRGPQILLILQTIALAAAAWPIFVLTKKTVKILGQAQNLNPLWRCAPLVMGLAWLLNPLLHNVNLFEFHLLPFTLVPLLYMLLAYSESRMGQFLLFATVAMLFREDVSLVVAAVGVLAALEKRGHWWRVIPILFGASWFLAATAVISHFAPESSYKFSVYYAWLGEAPLSILPHLISIGNFEMLLGFGMPLLFLPFVTPKRLVLAAGPFLQIVLSSSGGSAIILNTHYAVLFLPGLFLSGIAGIEYLMSDRRNEAQMNRRNLQSPALLGLLLLATSYSALSMGPIPAALGQMFAGTNRAAAENATQIVSAVPKDEAVVASYSVLPHLSSRQHVYNAGYAMLGVQQFDTGTYALPTDRPLWLALSENDLQIYRAQYLNSFWAAEHFAGGYQRLGDAAGPISIRAGDFILFAPRTTIGDNSTEFWKNAAESAESTPIGINILNRIGTQINKY